MLLDKSPELVITALGVAKSGAVYLPVDPTYPPERLEFILADCDAKLVIREPVGDLDGQPSGDPTDADRIMAVQLLGTELMMEFIGSTDEHGNGIAAKVRAGHRNNMCFATRNKLAEMST